MHLTVFCPHCQSRYQLDPSLLGKKMRCPNALCRMIFEVREEGEAAPPLPARPEPPAVLAQKQALSGNVGAIVPILPCEPAGPEPEVARSASGPDREAGRQGDTQTTKEGDGDRAWPVWLSALDDSDLPGDDEGPLPTPLSGNENGPAEMQPGMWEAPPVRGEHREEAVSLAPCPAAGASPSLSSSTQDKETTRRVEKSRRSALLVFVMLASLAGVLGGGFFLIGVKSAASEETRFKKARDLYENQEFEEAMGAFQKLLREFPSSANRRQYDFLVELSAVREAVYAPREQIEERAGALERVLQFLEIYKNDPLLKEYHGDVWNTLQRLAAALTSLAEQKQDASFLKGARRSWAEAAKFTPPAGARVDEIAKTLNAEFSRVDNLLAVRAARLELLDDLRALAAQGSAAAVRAGRALAKDAGMEHDPEVALLLEELVRAHRVSVVFTPANTGALKDTGALTPRRSPGGGEDNVASFYVTPQVGKVFQGRGRGATPKLEVALALARGVLYALHADRGDVLWVRRVGVDTSLLPLRVPASLFSPELVLVVSSDKRSVAAVTAETGDVIWEQTLSGVCIGQPVLVDRHLLVPTLAGQVEEIEITGGIRQGSYALGQPLVVGGVHQPGTALAYFPADGYCVYVLDVAKRACAAVLYTGHAPGSLRGVPLVWNEEIRTRDEESPLAVRPSPLTARGWLLLSLASGAGSIQMRPYALPIRQPDQQAVDVKLTIRGDAWTAPWHDGDKLALATDAGVLALYGIRQKGNRDPLLFPLLQDDYRLEMEERASQAPAGSRALVVHADAENYWVMSAGKLQRLQATFTARAGPGLVGRWPWPLDVGAPLHAGQVHLNADGQATLIVVTQELDNPTCWVRALDAEQGQVLWQRQLGMVCQDQPLAAAGAVLCPAAKGLFLFDRKLAAKRAWQPAGTFLERASKETGHWAGARGPGFVDLSWDESALHVRLLDGKGVIEARTHPLAAPPLGTPALGSDFVLLPLANGVVLRVPLGAGAATSGPDWRGAGVDESQPGHIVGLGNDEFAITDGGRSLLRLHWGEAGAWEKRGEIEMPHRITSAPAALGNRLLVADASAAVTMLEGERLTPGRRWTLADKITSGPFVRAKRVGLVVGKNRLVWIDPGKDQPAWEYTFVAPVVGQPELIDELLVVADLQGGIMGLDPVSGNPAGPGYRLKANEAPSAAPVAFGHGQAFVPLMDGTVMVLPIERLRNEERTGENGQ